MKKEMTSGNGYKSAFDAILRSTLIVVVTFLWASSGGVARAQDKNEAFMHAAVEL
jgi:hypothetical protein